jgi:uncharacterized protein (DUF1697 family)
VSTHIALLRAVNVGGTGKLPMAELRARCTALGFANVRSYIASGNLVLESKLAAPKVQAMLESLVSEMLGKPASVLMRTAADLAKIIATNPYKDAEGNRVIVLFLEKAPPTDALKGWKIPGDEQLTLVGRELFIHFPSGQGRSKLKVPFQDIGTGRNLNTVRTLLAMATEQP